MPPETRWVFPEKLSVPQAFQDEVGGHPLVARSVYQRGYRTLKSARGFLDPQYYQPTSAHELPDMAIACDLLDRAIRTQAHILVWGDFDVDGQTATTVLVEGLRDLGAKVSYHIPVRGKESHGIHPGMLKSYLTQGFDLLLTCDTGITEHTSLQIVRNQGIPVIVSDHHLPGESLPPANAVINPQRLTPGHPLRTLPGVGVAYKLIEGLCAYQRQDQSLDHLLELVALGIVADVAEQRADTRYLLQKGLRHLRETQRLGLNLLYQNATLNPANLNEGHIGFQIAPRLNAVGRLGDANLMVEFFTTADQGRARVLANLIEGMNIKRRAETRQVEQAAELQLARSSVDRHAPAIVLHHPGWPGGVVGIVANRLAERYQKPVVLLTGEDPIHGSARSISGLHITEAISAQADLLAGFGGHPMAAGLSMAAQNYPAFKRRFLATVESELAGKPFIKEIEVAQEININQLNLDLVSEIQHLAPFGAGNPPLNFMVRDLRLVSHARVGGDQAHRQVVVRDGAENELRLIWWNGGEEPLPEAQFDLVCTLTQSDYRGMPQMSAEWVDDRLSEAGRLEIEARHVEVQDYRAALNPLNELEKYLQTFPDALVWGEGDLPAQLPFLGRHELGKCEHLAIWTAPPSQAVLEQVLYQTQARQVVVFAIDPNLDEPASMMNRLGGAAKYVIAKMDGQVALDRMAAACAADTETVRIGLLLWQARGKLTVRFEGDVLCLVGEAAESDRQASQDYEALLARLLDESRAYRRYFRKGDLGGIITR